MSDRKAPPTQYGDGAQAREGRAPRTRGVDPVPHGGAPRTTAADGGRSAGRAPRTRSGAEGREAREAEDLSRLLPAALADRFTPIREFERGGQGDVLLCAARDDPATRVVVKVFKRSIRPGEEDPREAWRALDPAHVVRFVDPWFGRAGSRWWEVLEYCRAGTLRDLADYYGGAIPEDVLRAVVRQIAAALDYLHTRKPHRIVHRDIKPDNILVRGVAPLDVVLTDFGLAVASDQTYELRTVANTVAYAAPEVVRSGIVPPAGDWWSLGMTVAELAAGRHPYRLPTGEMMAESLIIAELAVRDVPLEGVRDERLRLLVSGLLTRDPDHRWRGEQVRAWLSGRSPQVRPSSARHEKQVPVLQWTALRGTFADPPEVAAAMTRDWSAAARLFAGRGDELEELVGWLSRHFPDRVIGDVVASRAEKGSPYQRPDRAVAEVIARLDPSRDPVFQGESMLPADLLRLPARVAADPDGRLGKLVKALFDCRALRSYEVLAPGLAAIDGRWHVMTDEATEWFKKVPQAGGMTPTVLAMILGAAVEVERKR